MTANAKPDSPLEAIDPSKALIPQVQKVNEMRVKKDFWPKIRRTAARIPFANHALAAWYATQDPKTPVAAKGIMLGALAYFVLPADVIPDVFLGIGFTDDAAVFAALLTTLGKHIKPLHHQKATEALDRLKRDKAGEGETA